MSMLLAPSKEAAQGQSRPRPTTRPTERRRAATPQRPARPAHRDDVRDPLGGVAVPERRRLGALGRRSASAAGMSGDRRRVEAEQRVGAGADRHRALGVVAQGEAGDAEVGRLLLDPAGVGEDGAGVGQQREEVEVAERLDQVQARAARPRRLPASCGSAGGPGRRPASRRRPRPALAIVSPSSGPSTSAGRCRVTSRNPPGSTPSRRRPRRRRKRSSSATRVSIIVLPTKCIRSSAIPSARRFSIASSLCRKR